MDRLLKVDEGTFLSIEHIVGFHSGHLENEKVKLQVFTVDGKQWHLEVSGVCYHNFFKAMDSYNKQDRTVILTSRKPWERGPDLKEIKSLTKWVDDGHLVGEPAGKV